MEIGTVFSAGDRHGCRTTLYTFITILMKGAPILCIEI